MKRPVFLLLVLAAILLGLGAWFWFRSSPAANALAIREIATRGLADYLTHHQIGTRVLVLANPYVHQSGMKPKIVATEEAGIRGLTEGLKATPSLGTIAFPELKPEARDNPRSVYIDPQATTPLSFLVATDSFDQALAAHSECDVVVSLIGLPVELDQVKCWQRAGSPRFALLLPDLRIIGNRDDVQRALQKRQVGGVCDEQTRFARFGNRRRQRLESRVRPALPAGHRGELRANRAAVSAAVSGEFDFSYSFGRPSNLHSIKRRVAATLRQRLRSLRGHGSHRRPVGFK